MWKVLVFFLLVSCSKEEEAASTLTGSEAASKTEEVAVQKFTEDQVIRGTITMIPDLQKYLKKDQQMFVFVRDFQTEQVIALKKYDLTNIPFIYEISPKDQVLPNSKFTGPFKVFAKVDKDGLMGAPESGDLWGTYPGNPVFLGATNINITVDTIQP